MSLADVARCAVDRERDALETLVRSVQDDLYGLALRVLCNREDAADTTPEILVRIITRLA